MTDELYFCPLCGSRGAKTFGTPCEVCRIIKKSERKTARSLIRGVCFYCNCNTLVCADHVVPIMRGGPDTAENIVDACQGCNGEKSDRLPSEWLGADVPVRVLEKERSIVGRLDAVLPRMRNGRRVDGPTDYAKRQAYLSGLDYLESLRTIMREAKLSSTLGRRLWRAYQAVDAVVSICAP